MAGQQDLTIDYIEFPATDIPALKSFYGGVFGWEFVDYGPEYTAFTRDSAGIDGGFTIAREARPVGTLAVLYATDLEATLDRVTAAGGDIVEEIFSFPGGRRFHFKDPSGNELAVWSDQGVAE